MGECDGEAPGVTLHAKVDVHKKYQERVPGGSMRTAVQVELVGLSLYDGEEDYEFWPTSTESSATTSGRTRSGALGIGSRSRRVERNR